MVKTVYGRFANKASLSVIITFEKTEKKKKGKWLSFFFFAGKNGAFSKESLLLVNTPFSFNRAADVIDALKSRVPDPCVTCQWGVVGSETNTLATLHVTSPDVGDMGRLVCILF